MISRFEAPAPATAAYEAQGLSGAVSKALSEGQCSLQAFRLYFVAL
jgi:hypothetical protein